MLNEENLFLSLSADENAEEILGAINTDSPHYADLKQKIRGQLRSSQMTRLSRSLLSEAGLPVSLSNKFSDKLDNYFSSSDPQGILRLGRKALSGPPQIDFTSGVPVPYLALVSEAYSEYLPPAFFDEVLEWTEPAKDLGQGEMLLALFTDLKRSKTKGDLQGGGATIEVKKSGERLFSGQDDMAVRKPEDVGGLLTKHIQDFLSSRQIGSVGMARSSRGRIRELASDYSTIGKSFLSSSSTPQSLHGILRGIYEEVEDMENVVQQVVSALLSYPSLDVGPKFVKRTEKSIEENDSEMFWKTIVAMHLNHASEDVDYMGFLSEDGESIVFHKTGDPASDIEFVNEYVGGFLGWSDNGTFGLNMNF